MPETDLISWLAGVGAKHGFLASTENTAATCEPTRPSEVISGSSSSQYSYGGNTNQSAKEGGDFGDKSRENAESDQGSGSNPMQSPNLGNTKFAKRFGVGFLCGNYQTWGDLADVAAYAKPTSKYMQAFKGMDKSQQYKDPKSAAIVSGIQTWTKSLAKAVAGCGQGELVVSFQGHGSGGNIYGVDEKAISPANLQSLAKKAEASRVSITYILDACETGSAVATFQHGAADRVDENVDKTEGAGLVCSQENYDKADELKMKMAHARTLVQMNEGIAKHGSKMVLAAQAVDGAKSAAASAAGWIQVTALNVIVLKDIQSMQAQFQTNMDFGADAEMKLDVINKAFSTVIAMLKATAPGKVTNLHKNWAGKVGEFQDIISDGANRIIKICNQRAKQYVKSKA